MGNIHQLSVRDNLRKGKPGMLYDQSQLVDEDSLPHNPDKAQEVTHVEVTTGTADTDYQFEVNGEPVKITTDSSVADLEEVATALRDEANSNPIVRGLVTATVEDIDTGSDGVDETVVLTANWANTDIEVTSDDANLDVSVDTEAGEVEDILPGRAIFRDSNGQATATNPNSGSNLDLFEGVAAFTYDSAPSAIGTAEMKFESPRPVPFIRSGRVYVTDDDGASRGDDVWIEEASGDDLGKFYTQDSGGNTRIQLTGAQWFKAGVIEIKQGL